MPEPERNAPSEVRFHRLGDDPARDAIGGADVVKQQVSEWADTLAFLLWQVSTESRKTRLDFGLDCCGLALVAVAMRSMNRLASLAWLAWLATTAINCGPSARGPNVSPDAAPTAIDAPAAAAVCYEPAISGTVQPGASNIQSCAIWNNVARMTGMVTVSRDPSMMTMSFGALAFTGTVTGRNVALTHFELHDFTDGCLWRATETLTGDLDPATCVMALDYQYAETIETNNGACSSPCSGTGSFALDIVPIIP